MIDTGGNIIGLTTLLAGIHSYFLNRPDEAKVELKYGDHRLNEQFVVTSDRMPGELRIYMSQNELTVNITFDGCLYYTDRYTLFDGETRRLMRTNCIALLNGTTKINMH